MTVEQFGNKYDIDVYDGCGILDFLFGIQLVWRDLTVHKREELCNDIMCIKV